MPVITDRIADFSAGEKGLEQAISREVEGSLIFVEECFYYKNFLAKRPPLKMIAPLFRHASAVDVGRATTMLKRVNDIGLEEVVVEIGALTEDNFSRYYVVASQGVLAEEHPYPLRTNSIPFSFDRTKLPEYLEQIKNRIKYFKTDQSGTTVSSFFVDYNGEEIEVKVDDLFIEQNNRDHRLFHVLGSYNSDMFIATKMGDTALAYYYVGDTRMGLAYIRSASAAEIASNGLTAPTPDHNIYKFIPLMGDKAEFLSSGIHGSNAATNPNILGEYALSPVRAISVIKDPSVLGLLEESDFIRLPDLCISYSKITPQQQKSVRIDLTTGPLSTSFNITNNIDPDTSRVIVSATRYRNLMVEMYHFIDATKGNHIGFQVTAATTDVQGVTTQKSVSLILQKLYGIVPLWVRTNTGGIIFATEMGIYIGVIGQVGTGTNATYEFTQIIMLSNRPSSSAKPVSMEDFVIYVDYSGKMLKSVFFDVNTPTGQVFEVISLEGLLSVDEQIDKIVLVQNNGENIIYAKLNNYKCYAIWFRLNALGRFEGASASRIFTNYKTKNILSAKDEPLKESLYWIGEVADHHILARLDVGNIPNPRRDDILDICLDFYTNLNSDFLAEIRPVQELTATDTTSVKWLYDQKNIEVTPIPNRPNFYRVSHIYPTGDVPFRFTNDDIGKLIYLDNNPNSYLRIDALELPDATAVIAEGNGQKLDGTYEVYKLAFNRIPLMFYMQPLVTKGYNVLAADTSGDFETLIPKPNTELALRNGEFSWNTHITNGRIGVEYKMRIVTAPLGNQVPIAIPKRDATVSVEILASRVTKVYCGLHNIYFNYAKIVSATLNSDEEIGIDKWIRQYTCDIEGGNITDSLMVLVEVWGSSSAIVTCMDITFTYN